MKIAHRRGSALLIVLGMLSFMVVSAVSFAIYMRQSRLPSSYLRRNIAARSLVRAALAKAVDELEGAYNDDTSWGGDSNNVGQGTRFYGVYDDPFPGSGTDSGLGNDAANGDLWINRVFCPFGEIDDNTAFDSTVPVLTLEGLAYLPPAIVDDVRFMSRRTRTAAWRTFPYEAGRYAYCAVNVSDLFDVNRLSESLDVPRNSSARGRVSLASLCQQTFGDPSSYDDGAASALQSTLDLVQNQKVNGNVVPFVSMADFSLFAGVGSAFAPFCSFVGSSGGSFYTSQDGRIANALFVTDTWFPPTNSTSGASLDLANNQPFTSANSSASLWGLYSDQANDATKDTYVKRLGMGFAALYDYLDKDSIPCSLAFPTVEEVPMIVGISRPAGLKLTIGNIGGPVTANLTTPLPGHWTDNSNPANVQQVQGGITIARTRQLKGITSFGSAAGVSVMLTYPFKRMQTKNLTKAFKLRGVLRVYLAETGMGCRPGNNDFYPSNDDWWRGRSEADRAANGLATFYSDTSSAISITGDNLKQSDSGVIQENVRLTFDDLSVQIPICWDVTEAIDSPAANSNPGYTLSVDVPTQMNAGPYQSLGSLSSVSSALRPFKTDGSLVENWNTAAKTVDWTKDYASANLAATDPKKALTGIYRFYAAVWVQVLDGDQVVDMVPARLQDDIDFLGHADLGGAAERDFFEDITGGANKVPLMNFEAQEDITFGNLADAAYVPQNFAYDSTCQSLYVADPRYNFAPENWYASTDATPQRSTWLEALKTEFFSKNVKGQARDVFMFVSNQEYLQSLGELQFLPDLQALDTLDGKYVDGNGYYGNFSGRRHGSVTSLAGLKTQGAAGSAHGDFFWRTYCAYAGADDIDPYANFPYTNGDGGFKLNPYSRDDRVLFAATANTPFDYFMTSTNANNTLVQGLNVKQMRETYAFGPNATAAKLSKEELLDITGAIKDGFANCAKKGDRDWKAAWNSLNWQSGDGIPTGDSNTTQYEDNNLEFLDVTLQEPLHEVDRKFLYSFWRDCFDNRQQLFLIFVRAEPATVGGGGSGNAVSSQLGGRAVALVWRDPEPPASTTGGTRPERSALRSNETAVRDARRDNPPHRTRLLFYHQCE